VDSINQIETVTLVRGCCRFVSSPSPQHELWCDATGCSAVGGVEKR